MTWPLARDFTTRICGDIGDPQSELWSMRWMRDALVALRNPFFTARVFHPQGTTLVFNTFDIPSTLLVVPMWGWASEVVIYNTAVLVAFALTAYGMACLARELTGDVLAGVLAGLLFAGVPYHYAHLRGQLHLVSMGWVPLYLVYLLRVVDDRGRERDALLAGVFLALASLASWYHLVFAVVITIPLAIAGAWRHHGLDGARRLARRATVLGLAWAVLAGPLLAAIFVARQREPILGAHDPIALSADAAAFFDPASLALAADGEQATYVGFTVAVLAVLGAFHDRSARRFLVVAVVGGLLALGPMLTWRGEPLGWRMPYAYLEPIVPGLSFTGVPVRFGYVLYTGLVVAAAFGLRRLRRLFRSAALGRIAVVALTTVALWEYWPGPVPTSFCPEPAPMRAWAADAQPWAVVDATGGTPGGCGLMWHGTLHRKPLVGGYIGRRPKRLEDWIVRQPVLAAVMLPDAEIPLARVDPRIDFAPIPGQDDGLAGDRFSADWNGSLHVPASGLYAFRLLTPTPAMLEVDGVAVVRFGPSEIPPDGHPKPVERTALVSKPVRTHSICTSSMPRARPRSRSAGRRRERSCRRSRRTRFGLRRGAPASTRSMSSTCLCSRASAVVGGRDALRDLSIRYVVTAEAGNELRRPGARAALGPCGRRRPHLRGSRADD